MAVRTDKVQVDVEINGKKAGDSISDLQKSYKQLNRERNKMTIGTDEYVKKTEELKKVGARLGEVRNEVKGVDQANKGLLQGWMEILPFNGHFQKLNSTIGAGKGQVGGLASGFKTLRGAIISTGLGALVVVFGLLVNWLMTTQEGIDKVTSVTRPLSAVFERLKGVLQDLGGKLFKQLGDAIKNPKQALSDLVDFMKDQVMARFQAIGVAGKAIMNILKGNWAEGVKGLGDAVIQGTTGIRDGINKINDAAKGTADWLKEGIDLGTQLDQMQKNIEKTEIELIKNRARLNGEFEKAKEIAQDQSRSEEERRKAAQDAQKAQNELLQQEQDFLTLKIEKMKLEHSQNDTSREDERALSELIAQRTEMEANAARKRASAKNLENSINKQMIAEEQKRPAESRIWHLQEPAQPTGPH